MKVKICGITDIESALYAVQHGADALGFVFAKSKRRITPAKAREIIAQLPEHILKVGVFVNETKEEIEKIAAAARLTAIQLHGDEPPQFCQGFDLPVIKALSIGSQEDLKLIDQYDCDYLLLDSPVGKYRGGNGVSFDWSLLQEEKLQGKRIILAGGLTADNVSEAIAIAKPHMVDVSSGVETDGRKDLYKIRDFLVNVKKCRSEGIVVIEGGMEDLK